MKIVLIMSIMFFNNSLTSEPFSYDVNRLIGDIGRPPVLKCVGVDSVKLESIKMGACPELSTRIKDIFNLNNPRTIKRSTMVDKETIEKRQKENHFFNIQHYLTVDSNLNYTPYMEYKKLEYDLNHPRYAAERLKNERRDRSAIYGTMTDEKKLKLVELGAVEYVLEREKDSKSMDSSLHQVKRLQKLRESLKEIFEVGDVENLKSEHDIYTAALNSLEFRKTKDEVDLYKLSALNFLKEFYYENYKQALEVDSIEEAEFEIIKAQNRLDESKLENFGAVDHINLLVKDFDQARLETFKIENVGKSGDKNGHKNAYPESYGENTDITYALSTTSKNGSVNSISINYNVEDMVNFNHLNENHAVKSGLEYGEQSMGPTIIFTPRATTFGTSTTFDIENCKIKSAQVRGEDLGLTDSSYRIDHTICSADTDEVLTKFCDKFEGLFSK